MSARIITRALLVKEQDKHDQKASRTHTESARKLSVLNVQQKLKLLRVCQHKLFLSNPSSVSH